MKSKKPKTVSTPAAEEPETLESHLAAVGQFWPDEEEIARWNPLERMLLGAELYADRDDIPPGEELEQVKERTRRVHLEALAQVKQLTQWLAGSLEKLRLVAELAQSAEVQKIAQEALADLYVEIGKEYARPQQKKAGGRLHSNLDGLLEKPAFRKRFEYRKSIQNHERDAVTPPMRIVVDAIQSDGGRDWFLWSRMGRGDETVRDEVWKCSVVPLIKARWDELRTRHLSGEKRQTFGSWKNRLRDSFNAFWEERRIRVANEPDSRDGPSNRAVSVVRAQERFQAAIREAAKR